MKKYCYRLVKYSISSSYLQGGKGNFCVVTGWGICTIFQAPLWGLSMNRPAPPRGFCSFPPPPQKKNDKCPRGMGTLGIDWAIIWTGIYWNQNFQRYWWNFINFHYWSQFLFSFNIRKWWVYKIRTKVTVKLKIMHLLKFLLFLVFAEYAVTASSSSQFTKSTDKWSSWPGSNKTAG